MNIVLDFYGPHTEATYGCLAQNAQGIARYLTNSPHDPRQLTPDEVRWAHAAGLEVHVVYEMAPTYAGYFTFDQGVADCQNAMARLDELGAPEGTVCYFAVDAPPSTIPVSVLDEYFNGVASVQTSRIVPGIYGFQAHIDYARTRFPNVGKHTWQTYGTPNGPLDLWQHLQEVRCGVEVDVNECSVSGWKTQEEEDMTATPQEIWDSGLASIVQEKVVAPQENTNSAIKKALEDLAASANTISDPEMRQILTKLGVALQSVGAK